MKKLYDILSIIVVMGLMACQHASVPESYTESNDIAPIYPTYQDVTIPINIAPLSFELVVGKLKAPVKDMVSRYSFGDEEIVCGGLKALPDIDDWKALTAKAKGKAIQVEVFWQNKDNDAWTRCKPFKIFVSPDSIDPYISYRLISPSYVTYEELTINQRCLENYDESVIYDNMLVGDEVNGQCINCHNYQMQNPERMQFHARQKSGGTIVTYDGNIKKVNMANDSILSAGVYPSWHPWLKLIAYSTNKTMQSFHTRDINKIEVLDSESDLIVYDIDRNEVMNVENDPHEFEIFPFWAPDGKTLYYCSAHFEYENDTVSTAEAIRRAKEIKYSIYRKSFNPETREFGEKEMVFDAASMSKSATLPRISPNGKYLLFTLGGWGCFHIWHRDADLWMLDLTTMEARPMSECNSNNVESYHTWSSNGKWIIFSSRRTDGVFTRPFIAHVDENGKGTKPFELPAADPDYHRQLMKSYNIPEFMKGPVKFKPQDIADVLKTDVAPVKYVNHLSH
ncbi:MAG: PD40 domain-containing protein [Prevotella sp.]|nr:PD40 domain-containing protein [Prevotella sp.]